MFFLRIADIIGIVISIIYYFFLFLKLHKGDNGPWVRIIALTLIGIITILLTFLISSRSNINPTENIIIGSFLTVECCACSSIDRRCRIAVQDANFFFSMR